MKKLNGIYCSEPSNRQHLKTDAGKPPEKEIDLDISVRVYTDSRPILMNPGDYHENR